MIDSLPLIFFAILVLCALTWIVLHRWVLGILAQNHASSFPVTSRRPVFEQGAMLQFFFICDFLFKRTYLRIGDRRITAASRLLKLLIPVIVLSFVGMMLSPMLIEVTRR